MLNTEQADAAADALCAPHAAQLAALEDKRRRSEAATARSLRIAKWALAGGLLALLLDFLYFDQGFSAVLAGYAAGMVLGWLAAPPA